MKNKEKLRKKSEKIKKLAYELRKNLKRRKKVEKLLSFFL